MPCRDDGYPHTEERPVDVAYILRITQDVRHEPGFGPIEDVPEVHLSFPDGTDGLTGPLTFKTVDGRSVSCFVDEFADVTITGSLE